MRVRSVVVCVVLLIGVGRAEWGETAPSGNTFSPRGSTEASAFFPLEVGNAWTYEVVSSTGGQRPIPQSATIRVVGTTRTGDKVYFLVTDYFFYWPKSHPHPDTVLFREEGSKVYWYFAGREYVYYDFAAPLGANFRETYDNFWRIPVFSYDQAYSGFIAKNQETPDGMIFLTDSPVEDDWPDEIMETFTRTIGRTYLAFYEWPFMNILLREAVIGGQRYLPPFVDPASYFPLQVGARWTYRWVYQWERPEGPERITTRVVGQTLIDGMFYFLVTNYFLDTRVVLVSQGMRAEVLPDTVLLRQEGSQAYIFLEGQEYMLYDFTLPLDTPMLTRWEIPVGGRTWGVGHAIGGPGVALFLLQAWAEIFAPTVGKIRVVDGAGNPIWELEELALEKATGIRQTTWGQVKRHVR